MGFCCSGWNFFRAEDSRIMADMKSMKKWCSQLYDINKVKSCLFLFLEPFSKGTN